MPFLLFALTEKNDEDQVRQNGRKGHSLSAMLHTRLLRHMRLNYDNEDAVNILMLSLPMH